MQVRTQALGTPWRRHLRLARRLIYWGLPPLVLLAIFSRIDLVRMRQLLTELDLPLFVLGLCASPLVVSLGGLRWHVLVRCHEGFRPRLVATIADYWRSLAVGFVLPGSIGTDAYRAVALGRQTQRYVAAVMLILAEKLLVLLACALVILALLPRQWPGLGAPLPDRALEPLLWALVAAGLAALAVSASVGRPRMRRAVLAVRRRFLRARRRMANRLGAAMGGEREGPATVPRWPSPRLSAVGVGAVLAISVLVFAVSAAQAHLFFGSVGYDVPFSTNLLVAPLLFVAFALPISFGTLGVREAAYLLFYGAFGVPAEPTLLVSFCGLAGMLCSYGIGALLLLQRRRAVQHAA